MSPGRLDGKEAGVPRGQLRVYLGAAPGVGTTHAMIEEGVRRKARGTDVVVASVAHHGRAGIVEIASTLGPAAAAVVSAQGDRHIDVSGIAERRPGVVLVDELAATHDGRARRDEVEELLAAGIDVITTMSVTEIDSLTDQVARITGTRPTIVLPDSYLHPTDQVEYVDMTPEALRRRLAHGNVFDAEEVTAVDARTFQPEVLSGLRHLALVWLADRIDAGLQTGKPSPGGYRPAPGRERIIVALSGHEPGSELINRAAAISRRTAGQLLGVHVTSTGKHALAPELERQRDLLLSVGGAYRELVSDDLAGALGEFCRVERATQLVIGAGAGGERKDLRLIGDLASGGLEADLHIVQTTASRNPSPPQRHRSLNPRPAGHLAIAWALGWLDTGAMA